MQIHKILAACALAFAMSLAYAVTDNLSTASNGCVTTASLTVPATLDASETVTRSTYDYSTNKYVTSSARYDYWWVRCPTPAANANTQYWGHVIAFRITVLSGAFTLPGYAYVNQNGYPNYWGLNMTYSGGSGQLVLNAPRSYDIGVLNSSGGYGSAPTFNVDPSHSVAINNCTNSSSLSSSFNSCSTTGATLPAAAPETANAGYADLWWNQGESGWGISITHHTATNLIFVAWYTYDGSGNPTWYVASSCPVIGNRCTGQLYRVNGGSSPTSAWRPNLAVAPVGTITLAFEDMNTGTMTYTLDNGATISKAIKRQTF